jgi:hypothetical protein
VASDDTIFIPSFIKICQWTHVADTAAESKGVAINTALTAGFWGGGNKSRISCK